MNLRGSQHFGLVGFFLGKIQVGPAEMTVFGEQPIKTVRVLKGLIAAAGDPEIHFSQSNTGSTH